MDQAVIAQLSLVEDCFGSEREPKAVADLADLLHQTINKQGVDEFDGEEFGEDVLVRMNWRITLR